MKKIFLIPPALTAIIIAYATLVFASPMCILQYDAANAYRTNAAGPCGAGTQAETGVKFACGGAYVVVTVFDQATATPKVKIGSYESKWTYSADLGTPVCDYNAPCYGSAGCTKYFDTNMKDQCSNASNIVWTSNVNMGGFSMWPATLPTGVDLFKTTFTTAPNSASATITFTKTVAGDESSNGLTIERMNSKLWCETPVGPPLAVKLPTGVSAGAAPATDCETSQTFNVTISYTKPTQCINTDTQATVACPATCTPGVTISSGGTPLSNGGFLSSGTSIVDPTPRPLGIAVPYTVTGVCTNGSGAAGTGAVASADVAASANISACGKPPAIAANSVRFNGSDPGTTFSAPANCPSINEGGDGTITGTITDEDSNVSAETISLVYGYESTAPTFPATVVTAAPTAGGDTHSGTFSIKIPGSGVKADNGDLYWAIWATDTTMATINTIYPSTYVGTVLTASNIPEACITKGTALGFVPGKEPYPNQMPFRAGVNQKLLINFALNDTAAVTMRIYAPDNSLIRQLDNSSGTQDNTCNWKTGCTWDGTNFLGGTNLVANGLYIVNIYAVGTGTNFGGQTLSLTKGIVVMK